MRRQARTLIIISILVVVAGLGLGFQSFKIGEFERGGDTLLGLSLGLDLQGGIRLVYQADTAEPPAGEDMEGLRRTLERRINSSGLGEPNIQLLGEDRILIQLPGIADSERARRIIGDTAQLEFKQRTVRVQQELENLTSTDIVSTRLTTLERLEDSGLVLVSATTTPAATPEISAITSPSVTATVEEPGAEGAATTTEAEAAEAPRPAGSATTTESAPPVEAATTTESASPGEAATTTEAAPGGVATSTAAAPSPAATTTDTRLPILMVEFTDEGADKFSELVTQLADSLQPVGDIGQVFPDELTVETKGGRLAPLSLSYQPFFPALPGQDLPIGFEPNIRRVQDTNTFTINLIAGGVVYEEAEERFGTGGELAFGLILGKVDEDVGLTGDDLARAYPGQHQGSGVPIVNIEFNSEGTRKFGEITQRIAGTPDVLAIFLDDEELIAPSVQQAITGGAAFIQGRGFTIDRVRDISLLLESGRLPIPIVEIQAREIDAILGERSLAKSVVAGSVGLGLVLLFMLLYYRLPGVVASVALVIYATLVLAIFKLLPLTLTLSGVGAVILSIGMAVDANILIFERMKDELRAGRTLLSAINIGFNRAWPAIRDSNVSTLITCAILFWFADTLGATIVQGFAVALAIGVGVSMFSAIMVSRTLLRLVAATPLSRKIGWFVPVGSSQLPQRQPRVQTA